MRTTAEENLSGLRFDFIYKLIDDGRQFRLDLRRCLKGLFRLHQVLRHELERLIALGLADEA